MGNSIRYIIVVLLIILIGVFGTIFIVGRFRNRNNNASLNQAVVVHTADYVNKENSYVVWTQEGRLVGNDLRRTVRIKISPTERKVDILEGYNQKIIKTAVFSNDKTAYTSFLLALENLRFGSERKVKQPDERGVCPLGNRFIYEIHDGSEQKIRLWSDSCATSDGTYAGNAAVTKQIFKAQITGYDKFITGTRF